jgi:hypothetical protein
VHRSKPFGVEFDIYVPEKKLAIEYCGLYWHSTHSITEPVSPLDKVHAMMYKHYSKWVLAKSHGVRLITIFEDEWLQSPDKVKAAIDVALGIRSKRIYARNCDTVRLESGESQQFFADNHLQGAPVGGVTLGLLHEGAVVAAMCFTKAASSRGKTNLNQWELSRYATSCGVVGGASKLLSAFLKQEVVNEIISYSDNRWFDGKMYEILGFERQKPIPADYTIVLPNRSDRVRKDQFQLSKLQKWCDKFGVPHSTVEGKSELEATFSLGCGRIYDCGKQKWLFTPKQPSGV